MLIHSKKQMAIARATIHDPKFESPIEETIKEPGKVICVTKFSKILSKPLNN